MMGVATSLINDPKHWRDRAEEARTVAEMMSDATSKQMMLRIATREFRDIRGGR